MMTSKYKKIVLLDLLDFLHVERHTNTYLNYMTYHNITNQTNSKIRFPIKGIPPLNVELLHVSKPKGNSPVGILKEIKYEYIIRKNG